MPELPEVEITRRGIEPLVVGKQVTAVRLRDQRLRWPVPSNLGRKLRGRRILDVRRRAKYLLLRTTGGTLLLHLGMSGSLLIVSHDQPPERHDHLDVVLENGRCLRLRDPRRFGAALWLTGDPLEHPLLAGLGPEPLDEDFTGDWLYTVSRRRRVAVKNYVMNARVVVGVGNIYASEALHLSGIHPLRAAGRISRQRYLRLADTIRDVLHQAIDAGGTTFRDFVDSDGEPGYFSNQLQVYGRAGKPCHRCGTLLRQRVIGQRSSFYCVGCQH